MKNKYFEQKKFVKNYIYAITIFIITLVIGISIFFNVVQSSVEKNSSETLITNVTQQSEHLNTILNINYSYLNVLAQELSKSEDLFSENNISLIKAFMENTDLNRTAIIDSDGNALYDNNVVKNVAHRRYFKESMQGKQSLSDPLESSVDQQTRVILSVPIYKNNQVIGVVGGSYNVTKLGNMLFDDLFSGNGYSLIVTKEGKIVAHTGEPVDHKLSYGEDIFTFYNSKTTREGHSISEVKQNFAMGEDGLVRLSGYADGSDRYLAYAPLGINDWMICYVASVTVAQQSYAFVEKYEMVFLGCFGILVCLLILYIIRKNRQKTEAILHSAQTDELTQVYSRKYAEQFAENALEEAKDGSIHAFFIMDIDKFKEVNDVYGHAVGDVVLRTFGVLLGRRFRGDDIVGRIGGDEFIILMRNVTTKEAVRTKAEQLMAETKKLVFDEMDGKGITISVGIALAPEHGKTYMNLYRSADQALYETKRNGRNGFTIYGENRDITENR